MRNPGDCSYVTEFSSSTPWEGCQVLLPSKQGSSWCHPRGLEVMLWLFQCASCKTRSMFPIRWCHPEVTLSHWGCQSGCSGLGTKLCGKFSFKLFVPKEECCHWHPQHNGVISGMSFWGQNFPLPVGWPMVGKSPLKEGIPKPHLGAVGNPITVKPLVENIYLYTNMCLCVISFHTWEKNRTKQK